MCVGSDAGRNSTNCHTTPFSVYKDGNRSAICWREHRITEAATVGTTLSIWREGGGCRVDYAATRREKTQIGTPRPSMRPAGLVPSATGNYALRKIETALLNSICCGDGVASGACRRRAIGCMKRILLGNLSLQHHKKCN